MRPPSFVDLWILEPHERELFEASRIQRVYDILRFERIHADASRLDSVEEQLRMYAHVYGRIAQADEPVLEHQLMIAFRNLHEAIADIGILKRHVSDPRISRVRFRHVLKSVHRSFVSFRDVLKIAGNPVFVSSSTSGLIDRDRLISYVFDPRRPIRSRYELVASGPLPPTRARLEMFSLDELRLLVRWLLTGGATRRNYGEYVVFGSNRDLLRIVIQADSIRKDKLVMVARAHTSEKKIYDAFITRET